MKYYLFDNNKVLYTHGDIVTLIRDWITDGCDDKFIRDHLASYRELELNHCRELDLNHWEDYARIYADMKRLEALGALEQHCHALDLEFYEAPTMKLFYEEILTGAVRGTPKIIMLTINSETLDRVFTKNGAGEWVQRVDGPIVKRCLDNIPAIMHNIPFKGWKPFAHSRF